MCICPIKDPFRRFDIMFYGSFFIICLIILLLINVLAIKLVEWLW